MTNNIDPWELLLKAREFILRFGKTEEDHNLRWSIDAALAAHNSDGIVKCEFCKGSGNVPYKKPWSPRDVLGG